MQLSFPFSDIFGSILGHKEDCVTATLKKWQKALFTEYEMLRAIQILKVWLQPEEISLTLSVS